MRRAERGDIETVRGLLEDAAAWLLERGIHQWPARFPEAIYVPAIEAGDTWLAEHDGATVGTVTLQWSDELIWGPRPADAGYVHRLVAVRSHAGLGRQLLEWAVDATRAADRRFVRLDCWSGNARLREYYERAGFVHRGDKSEATWTVSRYERPSA